MAKSFMRKLTYAALLGIILFGIVFAFLTGIVTATNGIAMFYQGAGGTAIFPQPFYEILLSLAIGLIPLADVVWSHTEQTQNTT